MSQQILVAYASISGSTKEVAEAIAMELQRNGADATAVPAREVKSLDGYNAAVIGSSIRVGRWLADAIRLVEQNEDALSTMPVAYFSTCLTMVHDTEDNRRKVEAYLAPIRSLAPSVHPVSTGMFAGSLDPNHRVKIFADQEPESDFRDFGAIEAWAREIRPILVGETAQPAVEAQPKGVTLAGAMLNETDMSGVDLSYADLREAKLHRARFVESNMSNADMRKADLGEADMRGSNLSEAGLYWADLRGSDLGDANLTAANLLGADLTDANLSGANCQNAVFNGALLRQASLDNTNLVNADFNWADLSGANLTKANLAEANLSWANLRWANLTDANLDGAYYNEETQWPHGFSAEKAGCIYVRRHYS
jgi:uncharacterized protein YjbI with pentapeptide repeats/flavodoxin